jgi:molybdenum cofactor cytidylyltransferase
MGPSELRIGAIVLAAGQSRRLGSNKLVRPIAGKAVIHHVLEAIDAAIKEPAIVVTGHESELIEAAVAENNARCVFAANHAEGMSQSLKAGVLQIPVTWDAALICLGDMPLLSCGLIERILREAGTDRIVIPCFEGQRGNPVLWGRTFFTRLTQLCGDSGGKVLLSEFDDRTVDVDWHVADPFLDVDTPEAFASVRRIMEGGQGDDP